MTSEMTKEHAYKLRTINGLLGILRTISPTLPVQVAQTFISVALNEGMSGVELARLIGAPFSTISRHLLDLGELNRKKEPGFALVGPKRDIQDRRAYNYYLTPKGRQLIRVLIDKLDGA